MYRARGRVDKKDVMFGYYPTVEEAFARVKMEKEKEIRKAAELYKPYMPEEIYNIAINYSVEMND